MDVLAERTTPQQLRAAAVGLSVTASIIHGAATPDHLKEWWGYGLFFVLAMVAQAIYSLLLVMQPWRWADDDGTVKTESEVFQTARWIYWAGIVGNLAVILLYVVSRTVGIPFFGPQAGIVEPLEVYGVVCKLAELAIVGCLALLLRREAALAAAPPGPPLAFDSL